MIEINWNPSYRELRFFAGGVCILASVALALGFFIWEWPTGVILSLAGVVVLLLCLAIFRLDWIKPIYLGWMIAVFPIGWTISHFILAVVYFGVFFPIGIMLRTMNYDPLQIKEKPTGESYWSARKQVTSNKQYFRQY